VDQTSEILETKIDERGAVVTGKGAHLPPGGDDDMDDSHSPHEYCMGRRRSASLPLEKGEPRALGTAPGSHSWIRTT
jgi:hypothetical protein